MAFPQGEIRCKQCLQLGSGSLWSLVVLMLAVAAMAPANFFDRCALGQRVATSGELAAELGKLLGRVAATGLGRAALLIGGEDSIGGGAAAYCEESSGSDQNPGGVLPAVPLPRARNRLRKPGIV